MDLSKESLSLFLLELSELQKGFGDRDVSLSQIDRSDYQIQGQMKCLKSDQLSNAIKVALRLFIALLRSSRASSADENSFCQAVSGTVPRCSQSQF